MDEVLFLSDDWLTAADEVLSAVRPAPPPSGASWSVGYRVTGGPAGTSVHHLRFDNDRVSARRGGHDDASVTLTMDWDLAVAINRGETSAQRAFLDGRIQLSGDPGLLLAHRHELSEIDAGLAGLRERTVYADHV